MQLFLTRLIEGLNEGVIYGFLALALVCTYRSSRALNLAQGEMAMFCTYIVWDLIHNGFTVIGAIAVGVLVGAVGGGVIERARNPGCWAARRTIPCCSSPSGSSWLSMPPPG